MPLEPEREGPVLAAEAPAVELKYSAERQSAAESAFDRAAYCFAASVLAAWSSVAVSAFDAKGPAVKAMLGFGS